MAAGRDAVDTALTTAFGWAQLTRFEVRTNEMHHFETRPFEPNPLLLSHDGIVELVV